jgi:hypothetical protein
MTPMLFVKMCKHCVQVTMLLSLLTGFTAVYADAPSAKLPNAQLTISPLSGPLLTTVVPAAKTTDALQMVQTTMDLLQTVNLQALDEKAHPRVQRMLEMKRQMDSVVDATEQSATAKAMSR